MSEIRHLSCQPYELELNQETVLYRAGFRKDNPVYSEAVRLYRPVLEDVKRNLRAQAVYEPITQKEWFGNREVVLAVMTVGQRASELSEQYFEREQYLEGILANGMADGYLFALEQALEREVQKTACTLGKGIEKRLEAPTDFPMEYYDEILERCQAERYLRMTKTESGMLCPAKSMCMVFSLSAEPMGRHTGHDCEQCTRKDCGYRISADK